MNKSSIPSLEEQMTNLKQMEDKDIDFSDIMEIRDFTGLNETNFIVPSRNR